jgi:hypothetical protein
MSFELLCITLIALLFGSAVCFGGYRLFLFLLPVWGFFFGFGLGAQTVQLLFGQGFLATITGWVVGFVAALLFAVLSYLFYNFAVGMIAGSLGYGLGVGLVGIFSDNLNLISWLVGLALGLAVIVLTFRFNLAKYIIIGTTALGGAAATIGTLVLGVENVQLLALTENPVRTMLDGSFIWTLLFLVMVVTGIVAQLRANRHIEIEAYNRFA